MNHLTIDSQKLLDFFLYENLLFTEKATKATKATKTSRYKTFIGIFHFG